MAYEDYMLTTLALSLAEFRKRATLARLAYTDVSRAVNSADYGETVRIAYVNRPDVEDAALASTPSAVQTASTTNIEFTMDRWKRVRWDVSDKDSYALGGNGYRMIAPVYGARLADWMEEEMFRQLAKDVPNVTGTVGTAVFASGIAAIPDALQAIIERDAERMGLSFFVRPAEHNALLKHDDFTKVDERGSEANRTQTDAALGRKFGFDFYVSNNIPKTTRASDGDFNFNGAAASGAKSIAVDGAGVNGVGAGELLTIGGKTYAVRSGISADAGNIELDRGLEAAASDDDQITSAATHGQCWALHPSAIAFSMRPTVSPDAMKVGAKQMSLADPETGFSLTLEECRIEHGTRYILSALFGLRVARPEQIQRVVSN